MADPVHEKLRPRTKKAHTMRQKTNAMRPIILKSTFPRPYMPVMLFVLLLVSRASAESRTWSGAGSTAVWSDGGNWDTAPVAGDSLVFSGTGAQCTNVNDLAADTSFASITFVGGTRNYLLSGNRIALSDALTNNSAKDQRLAFDILLNDTRTFHLTNGNLYAGGTISGTGGLTLSGGKILYLTGANTYQGPTIISNGVLQAANNQSLGSSDGGVVILSNGSSASCRLDLNNVCITGETVTVNGKGNNNGALQGVSGSNTWTGRIILGSAGENRFGVSSATAQLVLSGVIEGPSGNHMTVRNADECGPTILSNTNTYQGETQVIVGTLRLSDGDNRLPTNTLVRLGNSANVSWAQLDLNGCNQMIGGIANYTAVTMAQRITNTASNQNATLTLNASHAYTFSGTLESNLSLVKMGPSNLTLSATSNPFYGQTVVREGSLTLEKPTAILESTLNTGYGTMGTLDYGTNTVINFGGLCGTNNLVMTNRFGEALSLRIRGTQTTVYDGQISVGCDFTKAGSGMFMLNNANLYTGRTSIVGGTLKVASEDSFGVCPSSYVVDQIIFDGGILRSETNFTLAASNRGITLASGGGTLDSANRTNVFTLGKQLVGTGGFSTRGVGVVLVTESNAYDGVTTVIEGALRITNNRGLGNIAGGTVVNNGGELELGSSVAVLNETITINGSGITAEPPPPSVPNTNRGALQSAFGCTAEWAGPVILGSDQARIGAQINGHLIVSGVIDDGASSFALRTSSNPSDRTRGVEFRAHNTYGGSTDLTRGTLVLGISDALPTTTVLDVHWASSNNGEYTGLDLNGFDQMIGALRNSGNTGANAMITNRSASVSTLTVNQASDTVYGGTLCGPIALVKDGAGSLTLNYPTVYSGDTTVSGGTLALGVNDAVAPATALILAGGTLSAGGTTNTFASLTLSSTGTLDLGSGKLTFNSQTADDWTGTLNLTGSLGATTLRFQPALSASQLESIRYDGKRVMQNANGYIVPWRGTVISVL